jgi:hypothetical protein
MAPQNELVGIEILTSDALDAGGFELVLDEMITVNRGNPPSNTIIREEGE